MGAHPVLPTELSQPILENVPSWRELAEQGERQIVALRAEVERLQKAVEWWKASAADHRAERDALKADLERVRSQRDAADEYVVKLIADVHDAQAERDALKAKLDPGVCLECKGPVEVQLATAFYCDACADHSGDGRDDDLDD